MSRLAAAVFNNAEEKNGLEAFLALAELRIINAQATTRIQVLHKIPDNIQEKL